MTEVEVAILARVSGPDQETDTLVLQLREWAQRRVGRVYRVEESAWRGAHQRQLNDVYQDARQGKFGILLVWALDRLSREGPLANPMCKYFR